MTKLIKRKRDKAFSISFFDSESKDGKKYIGVLLSRNFKDKNNEWKSEDLHIFADDLLKIQSLCNRAYNDYQDMLENKPKDESQKEQQPTGLDDDFDDSIPF